MRCCATLLESATSGTRRSSWPVGPLASLRSTSSSSSCGESDTVLSSNSFIQGLDLVRHPSSSEFSSNPSGSFAAHPQAHVSVSEEFEDRSTLNVRLVWRHQKPCDAVFHDLFRPSGV